MTFDRQIHTADQLQTTLTVLTTDTDQVPKVFKMEGKFRFKLCRTIQFDMYLLCPRMNCTKKKKRYASCSAGSRHKGVITLCWIYL